jgi:transcriptional regulator with XRE-family HTH domain
MKLGKYLTINKITTRKFARQVGCSPSAAMKWRIGNRRPRLQTIAKIVKITKGQVQPNDWL